MNTTPEGLIRIKESLNSDIEDVVEYCKNKKRDDFSSRFIRLLLRYLFASDSTEYCNISDSVRT